MIDISASPLRATVDRRAAVKQLVGAVAVLSSPGALLASAPAALPTIRISNEAGSTIPQDFTGLSYESSQLAHPGFFHANNHTLIQYFRTLADHGVLRIGGNLSEFTLWDPHGATDDSQGSTGPDPGRGSDRTFKVTPHAIDTLRGFLDATGWRLIYGLNLARGKADSAVDEAKYVAKVMGDKLIALQFGNEPDLFKHNDDPNQKWTYEEFIAKWNEFYSAIRAALPNVPIAGPDTSNPKWNVRFAEDTGRKLVLETSHFYAEGPPTDPRMNIDYLLHPGTHQQTYVKQAVEVAKLSGLPYRMSEGNTCYNAGKEGVSDTFASALWVVDFMMAIAQSGGTGVNLHGGGSGLYTPIAGSNSEGYTARPIYYGMLLMRQLLGSTILQAQIDGTGKNVAAFAARKDGALQIIVLNRESEAASFQIALPQASSSKTAKVWRMEAPSVDNKSNVTLAHAKVTADGVFKPDAHETLRLRGGAAILHLAAYSAALVTIP